MVEHPDQGQHIDRRQALSIFGVLAVSLSVPVTVKTLETLGRYLLARHLADAQAKQQKWQMGARDTRPLKMSEAVGQQGQEQQGLVASDPAGGERESSEFQRRPLGRSEDLNSVPTTFFLDTRPPESLRGFADRSYMTMDGSRRWKQQEWLPLRVEDLPDFDGEHSGEAYTRIIDHFNVADPFNRRYAATEGMTFCNIFAWDVSRAMNVEIPRWINGEKTWTNSIYEWLSDPVQGRFLGWETVEPYSAQEEANKGYPVVVMTVPKNGRLGHMAMVIPGPGEIVNRTFYPICAQAGLTNFVGKSVYASQQFRDREVEYFVNQTSGYRFTVPGETGS